MHINTYVHKYIILVYECVCLYLSIFHPSIHQADFTLQKGDCKLERLTLSPSYFTVMENLF